MIAENVYQNFTVPGSVDADELEGLPLDLVVEEDGPVEQREQEVDKQVNQNVDPDQLEDAALPDQHQTPEPAVHRTAGLRVPVGVDVFASQLSTQKKMDLRKNLIFFFFVVLWSQSVDKLTIHSIPCSWII